MPDGSVVFHTVIDEIRVPQHDHAKGEKVFYLQKLQFEDKSIEYRFCYYIIGKKNNPKTEGKRLFGQFAPVIPSRDLKKIMKKAEKRNWF